MITEERLIEEIKGLEAAPVTLRNCEQLAVLRFLHNAYYAEPETFQGYSGTTSVSIPKVSNSDFINAISQLDTTEAWKIMDEAMTIMLKPLSPKMYNSVMRKISEKQTAG